jgi:NAD(P)-dependent dehydrogenase (short-subunit alcohol dehydrogenase family)
MQLTTKPIALVTGANRGIGFEIAAQLAQKNMTVLLGARNEKKGIDARDRLAARDLDVHFVLLDVTDYTMIQTAIGRIKDQFRRLDILVNNAGILIDAHTRSLELSIPILQNTMETNAFGPLLLSQACIPLMRQNNFGRIVNISSTLGSFFDMSKPASSHNSIGFPAYRLSKTLLNAITVLLAGELKDENILVNAACPGWVRTKLGGNAAPILPDQAAETLVWLATLPDDGPTGGFFRNRESIPW